jgi:hypothetical protein
MMDDPFERVKPCTACRALIKQSDEQRHQDWHKRLLDELLWRLGAKSSPPHYTTNEGDSGNER